MGWIRGLRASGPSELFIACGSGPAGPAALTLVLSGRLTPWWALLLVPLVVFNAVEVVGYVLHR